MINPISTFRFKLKKSKYYYNSLFNKKFKISILIKLFLFKAAITSFRVQ